MKRLLTLVLSLALLALPAAAQVQGASTYTNPALTATLVVAQATPGTLVYWNISNPNSSLVYVQFFDAAATGGITLGSTAPKLSIAVPPTNGVTDGVSVPGIAFQKGVVIAVTTTANGASAPGTVSNINLATN